MTRREVMPGYCNESVFISINETQNDKLPHLEKLFRFFN